MKTSSRNTRATRTPRRKPRLSLEHLERRDLLAGISLNAATGVLRIDGSTLGDTASVSLVNGQIKAAVTTPPHDGLLGTYFSKSYPPDPVKKVVFYGLDGNDTFINTTSRPTWAYGQKGHDTLQGGGGADYLDGGDGNDTLWGGAGNDSMHGGIGADDLHGEGGNDWMTGGAGNDTLRGNADHDTMFGGADDDKLYGGTGNDRLHGNAGNDLLHGGLGQDSLYGGNDADALYGDGGADKLDGGWGKDTLVSIGGGADSLTGGRDLDSIWMDTTDVLTDGAFESIYKAVHKVNQFDRYSYNRGWTTTFVSKELLGQNLADPTQTDENLENLLFNNLKTNVKDKPLFASGGPTKGDIFQGDVGDCYLMAPLSGIAEANPEFIRQMVVDLGDGTYAVRFYRNGQAHYVRVDADLWCYPDNSPVYAKLGQEGSTWVPIVEKAWAFFRDQTGDYDDAAYGRPTDPALLGIPTVSVALWDDLTPQQVINWYAAGSPDGVIATKVNNYATAWLNAVKGHLALGRVVTLSAISSLSNATGLSVDDPSTEAYEGTYRWGQHVFMVDAVLTNASGQPTGVKLRNPYGGYVTITDLTRLFFCVTDTRAWLV